MQTRKAFTLVELLVAMAIIGVLIGLAIFGITLVNRNARDTIRRAAVSDIYSAITDYYNRKHLYPSTIQFDTTGKAAVRENGTGTNCTGAVGICTEIPLDTAAVAASASLPMALYSQTTNLPANMTGYCYKPAGMIFARLESGDVASAGAPDGTICP